MYVQIISLYNAHSKICGVLMNANANNQPTRSITVIVTVEAFDLSTQSPHH